MKVYLCSWGTGAATFYVEDQPNHQPRLVGYRSPEAGDPAQSEFLRLALQQLKRHLNPPLRRQRRAPEYRRDGHAVPELVWFPPIDGHLSAIAS